MCAVLRCAAGRAAPAPLTSQRSRPTRGNRLGHVEAARGRRGSPALFPSPCTRKGARTRHHALHPEATTCLLHMHLDDSIIPPHTPAREGRGKKGTVRVNSIPIEPPRRVASQEDGGRREEGGDGRVQGPEGGRRVRRLRERSAAAHQGHHPRPGAEGDGEERAGGGGGGHAGGQDAGGGHRRGGSQEEAAHRLMCHVCNHVASASLLACVKG